MLIVHNRRFVKKHVIDGKGIFGTIKNIFKRAVTSKASVSLYKIAANDLDKTAISAAKSAGNELAISEISTARDIAIEKGKQFLEKSRNHALNANANALNALNNQMLNVVTNKNLLNDSRSLSDVRSLNEPKRVKGTNANANANSYVGTNYYEGIKAKSKEELSNLVNMGEAQLLAQPLAQPLNINNLMMGSAIRSNKISHANAIRIEDLVKKGRRIRCA